jgi:DUF438 domain-containing protein
MSEIIDNRAHRVETLKNIIKDLHAGQPADQVRSKLREIVQQTGYSEIISMEQQLMAEGMPASEIQGMCDLHSQVTREVLVQLPARPLPPGHPADTFRRENQAIQAVLLRMRDSMRELRQAAGLAAAAPLLLQWRQTMNELMDLDKHYQRKEHLLFSCLERHDITGPSKVMWGKDDEIRGLLKDVDLALKQDAGLEEWKLLAATAGEAAADAVEEMIYKEENILLRLALDTLTDDEWGEIWSASPRYGWCLVEPQTGYQPPVGSITQPVLGDGVLLPTGNLNLSQLTAIFSTLPVDLTFVDADDRVAFFSEGPDRVFARSRAIVGRKVQHCHPPRSVDVVDRILTDFREGRQSVAEFWINFQGRFVHIRYFALRDEQQQYLGTLEVTQELTHIRSLTGERRLLEYEAAS